MSRPKQTKPAADDGLPGSGFISIEEAGQHFGVAASTVRKWIDCGKLPVLRVSCGTNAVKRIDVRDLRTFIAAHMTRGENA